MNSKIYKGLLNIIIGLFLLSSVHRGFSQENWAPTSTGTNVPAARYAQTAVWTGAKMIIWGGTLSTGLTNTGGIYDPVLDSWTVTSTGANCPPARWYHTAVWTGTKMIVWGGLGSGQAIYNTGGVYDPLTDTWTATSTSGAPTARDYHTAVWTGSKMIVWGGYNSVTGTDYYNTGGIYDPLTDTWTAMSTTNAPTGRRDHSAIWTGSKMIVWGGFGFFDTTYAFTNTGGIYDPVTDTWTPTSIGANAPLARGKHTAVWTGSKMIIWGGTPSGISYNDGGIYDPLTDTWTATSVTNAPTVRYAQTAVWTGNRMIIWGGVGGNVSYLNTGGLYDPVADSWAATTTVNAPTVRDYQTAVMTPSSMIIWGGYGGSLVSPTFLNTGGIYTNPAAIGIATISSVIPKQFSLSQNYPNPFNPNSKIKFQIAKSGDVKLVVFDMLGREVETLVNENLNPGTYEVDFDGSKLSSGVYFYKLFAGSYSETKKMSLIK